MRVGTERVTNAAKHTDPIRERLCGELSIQDGRAGDVYFVLSSEVHYMQAVSIDDYSGGGAYRKDM